VSIILSGNAISVPAKPKPKIKFRSKLYLSPVNGMDREFSGFENLLVKGWNYQYGNYPGQKGNKY
jgi:hypothetical protein